ncbi:helicase-primase primase subunit [Equid alphaherpesvirus 3]|uniref:Helicase-primase primase subunit n=1 Tax=Equid alphaherpesvirus 3 TaxID=80341 RepID=A0A077B7H6_9ALPH|nr:helicase-primase primase subunit [Equid alphaherpesvirus 3]AIL02924.1 helicase-primase primase subunit [Equid alphaherpesvirus 3]
MASEAKTPSLRILYAADSCVITYSLMLLTGQESLEGLYVVSYDWSRHLDDVFGLSRCPRSDSVASCSEDERAQADEDWLAAALLERRPLVSFCLLSGMVGGASSRPRERVRPMFVCAFASAAGARALAAALARGQPLSTRALLDALDEEATFALHNDLVLALVVSTEHLTARAGRTASAARFDPRGASIQAAVCGGRGGRSGLTSVYIHHEQQVLAAFRRLYSNNNTTPFWFTSKFGPGEKSLVLATRYYLFRAVSSEGPESSYDLQAIKDFIRTYNIASPPNPTGAEIANLTSFAALSGFCCRSGYARGPGALALPTYVRRRVQADVSEVSALGEFIAADRQGLRLSDREFITYIYLAHFESFNRRQLRDHLRAVSVAEPAEIEGVATASSLKATTIENFFAHVRAQVNIADYISQNVDPRVVRLPAAVGRLYAEARTYPPAVTAPALAVPCAGICDSSTPMMKLLDRVEASLAKHGWTPTGQAGGCRPSAACLGGQSPRSQPLGGEDPAAPGAAPQCGVSRRLLHLAAAPPAAGGRSVSPVEVLFGKTGVRGPVPVYRVALPAKRQAFAVCAGDNWGRVTRCATSRAVPANLPQVSPDAGEPALARRDLALARATAAPEAEGRQQGLASACPPAQMYVNRNEMFNAALAVSNVVLDVDFSLRRAVPAGLLHLAMRGFRLGVVAAMSLIFTEAEVNWGKHPCYFYKTACPPPARNARATDLEGDAAAAEMEWMCSGGEEQLWDADLIECDLAANKAEEYEAGWEENFEGAPAHASDPEVAREGEPALGDTEACGCTEKMGFRVSVPVPPPYLLAGTEAVRGLARIIQQAVVMERAFAESMCPFLKDFSFVDTGVYAHGRSLRVPFFCKVDTTGGFHGRLLPFYVIPPQCECVEEFIAAHADPTNFHFHAAPRQSKVTRVVTSLGGEYVSFFERKVARNREAALTKRATLEALLARLNVSVHRQDEVEAFVADSVLEKAITHLEAHFPNHASEYRSAGVHIVVVKDDWILLQLTRAGNSTYRPQGFGCLRFKHLRSTRDAARTFLSIAADAHGRLCASISQQCFATKCGNNRMSTIFTLEVGLEK